MKNKKNYTHSPLEYDLGYGPQMCSVFGCIKILHPWEKLIGDRCLYHFKEPQFDLGTLVADPPPKKGKPLKTTTKTTTRTNPEFVATTH